MRLNDPVGPRVSDGDLVRGWFAEAIAPPPSMTVSEWADTHRLLARKNAAEPGRWRTERAPYFREIMDRLSPDDPCEEVVLMKGTQLGGTETGNNWIGYTVHLDPGPMMVVQPTSQLAKRWSRQRLAPMLESMPVLRARVRDPRSRDSGNTTLLKETDGGVIVIAGANSATDLRSMPVKKLFLDEVDAYPVDLDGEGDPIELAKARTDTFKSRRKILAVSTPTTKDFSRIEERYLAGDRRRYWVPCPECKTHQVLVWGNLKWPAGDPAAAAYACEHCGVLIEERHKPWMLERGEWRAEAPGAAGGKIHTYHLSSLYSPLGWKGWGDCARQFLRAQEKADGGDVSLLKVFVNTVLAETWEEQGDRVAEGELQRRAEDYPLKTVAGGALLTASCDVQGDRIEYIVVAWGRGEESWRVDMGAIYGDPRALLTGEDPRLDEQLRQRYRHANGPEMAIAAVAVDSGGHFTHEVYQFCRTRQHRHVFAIKGQSVANKPVLGKPSDVDVNFRGVKIKRGVKLWPVGADTAKSVIYGRLRLTQPGPGYMHATRALPPAYWEQVTAERLVTRYHKGRARLEWVKPAGRRNEALDLEVYAYAAACYLGVPRMSDPQWDKLERAVAPDLFTGQPAPPPPPAGESSPPPAAATAEKSGGNFEALQPAAEPPKVQRVERPPKFKGGFVNRWKG